MFFVSWGEFQTGDSGDLTWKSRLSYDLGPFTSLHFHDSVLKQSPHFFLFFSFSMTWQKAPFFPHYKTRFLRFWSNSGSQAPLASRQCTHTKVWMTYISSSCWRINFSSVVTCPRHSFLWAASMFASFSFSPLLHQGSSRESSKTAHK